MTESDDARESVREISPAACYLFIFLAARSRQHLETMGRPAIRILTTNSPPPRNRPQSKKKGTQPPPLIQLSSATSTEQNHHQHQNRHFTTSYQQYSTIIKIHKAKINPLPLSLRILNVLFTSTRGKTSTVTAAFKFDVSQDITGKDSC